MRVAFDLTTLIDGVIAVTLLEVAVLAIHHRRTGGGVPPRDIGLNMASGLCLMAALRCLAGEVGPAWVALCLLGAGATHLTDLQRRWRRGGSSAATPRRAPQNVRELT